MGAAAGFGQPGKGAVRSRTVGAVQAELECGAAGGTLCTGGKMSELI